MWYNSSSYDLHCIQNIFSSYERFGLWFALNTIIQQISDSVRWPPFVMLNVGLFPSWSINWWGYISSKNPLFPQISIFYTVKSCSASILVSPFFRWAGSRTAQCFCLYLFAIGRNRLEFVDTCARYRFPSFLCNCNHSSRNLKIQFLSNFIFSPFNPVLWIAYRVYKLGHVVVGALHYTR